MHIALDSTFGLVIVGPLKWVMGMGLKRGLPACAFALGCSGTGSAQDGAAGFGGSLVYATSEGGSRATSIARGGDATMGGNPAFGGTTATGGLTNPGGQTSTPGSIFTGGIASGGTSQVPTSGTKSLGGSASAIGGTGVTGANVAGAKGLTGGAPSGGGRTNGGGAPAIGGAKSSGGTSVTAGTSSTGGTVAAGGSPQTCAATYQNPVIWEDLPDLEVIRVDDTFYYTASTFHYSPGAPLLRSYDLVNWEYVGHSVPVLDFHASYDLTASRSYVNGIWASSLRYRKSNQTYYWVGCMHNVGGGYMFTATSPEGPWTKHSAPCYYDVGLLIDDDDKMYVAYGNGTISVAELSSDGFKQVKNQQVFTSPSDIGALEGSRFYRINGDYYIFTTQYANGEYVLRSTSGPFGPYTLQKFAVKLPFAGSGAGASPHQGGIVDTPNGDWYYMAFNDAYPAGRIPVLAPVTWSNGWPSVTLVNGAWGASYPFPKLPCGAGRVKSMTGIDNFSGETLEPNWEWNHNPDNAKWAIGAGLTLQTASLTSDLYAARNTLTHRIPGPTSTATIELDFSAMKDGDVGGLATLRDASAWIGIKRVNGANKVVMVNNLTLDSSWNTTSSGTEVASADAIGSKIWLRVTANIRTDAGGGQARFYYSTDGTQFSQLGSAFTMKKEWQFFLGYRYAIFNYATQALGGFVKVNSFQLAKP